DDALGTQPLASQSRPSEPTQGQEPSRQSGGTDSRCIPSVEGRCQAVGRYLTSPSSPIALAFALSAHRPLRRHLRHLLLLSRTTPAPPAPVPDGGTERSGSESIRRVAWFHPEGDACEPDERSEEAKERTQVPCELVLATGQRRIQPTDPVPSEHVS